MFTGFSSENPSNVRVWDFSKPLTSTTTPVVSLTNDCEAFQIILTGGSTATISLYLPENRVEGKELTIFNVRQGSSDQRVFLYSSDKGSSFFESNVGTASPVFRIGTGSAINLIYSRYLAASIPGSTSAYSPTGWISSNFSSPSAAASRGANTFGGISSSASYGGTAVGGNNNKVIASDAAIFGGTNCTSSGSHSTAVGAYASTASGDYSGVYSSFGSTASGNASAVFGGSKGDTRTIRGNIVFPAHWLAVSTAGQVQSAKLALTTQTTDATLTTLTSDGSAAASNNQVSFDRTSAAYYFKGSVVATDGTSAKGWSIEGVIKRNSSGTTSMVGTPTVTSSYADAGASTWAVSVTADATLNCIAVKVTGAAGVTIRWVCEINTTEGTL